jgi:hypothetical protein
MEMVGLFWKLDSELAYEFFAGFEFWNVGHCDWRAQIKPAGD